MSKSQKGACHGIKVTVTRRKGSSRWYYFTVSHRGLEELKAAQTHLSGPALRSLFDDCKVEGEKLHILLTDGFTRQSARDRGHETAIKLAIKNIRIAINAHREMQEQLKKEQKTIVLPDIPRQRTTSLELSPQGA